MFLIRWYWLKYYTLISVVLSELLMQEVLPVSTYCCLLPGFMAYMYSRCPPIVAYSLVPWHTCTPGVHLLLPTPWFHDIHLASDLFSNVCVAGSLPSCIFCSHMAAIRLGLCICYCPGNLPHLHFISRNICHFYHCHDEKTMLLVIYKKINLGR